MPVMSRSRSRDRSPRGRSRSPRRRSPSPPPPPLPPAAPVLYVPEDHERYVAALVHRCGGFAGIHDKVVQQNNQGEYIVVPRKAFQLRDKRLHEIEN